MKDISDINKSAWIRLMAKVIVVKNDDDDTDSGSGYYAFLTSARAQAKLAELQQSAPDSQPRILSSVVLDEAVKAPKAGTILFVFEHEADSEMVFLCAATRAAAQCGLDKYYKGGAESYDLDHPLQVTPNGPGQYFHLVIQTFCVR